MRVTTVTQWQTTTSQLVKVNEKTRIIRVQCWSREIEQKKAIKIKNHQKYVLAGNSPNSVTDHTKYNSQTSTLAIDFVYKIAAECQFDMLYNKMLKL
jgi:hypothetical protein